MVTTTHRRRGFSLIEAAIVLAVVGLVIGGIWAAVSTLREKYAVSQTVSGILSTVEGTRRFTKGFNIFGTILTPLYQAGAASKLLVTGCNPDCKSPYFDNSVMTITLTMIPNASGVLDKAWNLAIWNIPWRKVCWEFTKTDFTKNGIVSVGGATSRENLRALLESSSICEGPYEEIIFM